MGYYRSKSGGGGGTILSGLLYDDGSDLLINDCDLLPKTTGVSKLGSSSKYFLEGRITTLYAGTTYGTTLINTFLTQSANVACGALSYRQAGHVTLGNEIVAPDDTAVAALGLSPFEGDGGVFAGWWRVAARNTTEATDSYIPTWKATP